MLKYGLSYLLMAVLVCTMVAPLQAGVVKSAIDFIARRVVGMADDAAAGVVRQAAQKSPAMSRLVQKYGEGAVLNLARNSAHVRLLSEVGEESAEALLVHGDVALNILRVCPDSSAAVALSRISRPAGQLLEGRVAKADLRRDDVRYLLLIVEQGGDKAAGRLAKMSKGRLQQVLRTARTAGVTAAAGLVTGAAATADNPGEFVANLANIGSWCIDHPWMALTVLLVLVSLPWWLPLLGGLLWRMVLRRLLRALRRRPGC
ncbi:MAG: hypothetical protein Q4F40_10940 [Akkermansia sp.]|nr:hypothetical protein [Akkermansia sp.]